MFKEELDFFINNQEELVRQHRGRVLVLRFKEVVGVYDTLLEAYLSSKKQYEPGTFMIQRCEPGPDAYTVTLATSLSAIEPTVFAG